MRDPAFYLWMSYGVTLLAVVVELFVLSAQRRRSWRHVEEERDLEAQD